MSFHKACKYHLSHMEYGKTEVLSGYKWLMCLLKLAPHIAEHKTKKDPGGAGYSLDKGLNQWIYK